METCRRITQHVQYLCARCSTILRESAPLDNRLVNSAVEDCPGCGCSLLHQVVVKRQLEPRPVVTGFQVAYDMAPARFSFDITAIDRLLDHADKGIVCVTSSGRDGAWHANTLVTRACVHALMSKRQGGFESQSVMFIDAGNCSDIYECVDFARQYGLDSDKILDRIIVSRPFTIHQLARLIVYELQSTIQRFHAKLVVVSDILHMFVQDPQIDTPEARWLLNEIALGLRRFSAQALVLVSMTHSLPEYACKFLSLFDSRIDMDNDIAYERRGTRQQHRVRVRVSNRWSRASRMVTLPKRDLRVIPAR